MTSRKYSATDYGTCRFILENSTLMEATVSNAGGKLTVARANRLRLLRLLDGELQKTRDGSLVRLSGLGVKTGREAQRRGIASV